jgi:cytochrome c biogenesis protein CcmG/thiol:disulfide interchange protein DsbE
VKRWIFFLPLGLLAAALLLFSGYALTRKTAQVMPDALVGQPLPGLALVPLTRGPPAPLRTTAGGPALINVFASWCAPCAVEHPELMKLREEGVRIVGVAYKDRPAKTAGFIDRLGNPYAEILTDPTGAAGIELGVSGVPETFAVDKDGIVVAKHSGPLTAADAARLARALKGAR